MQSVAQNKNTLFRRHTGGCTWAVGQLQPTDCLSETPSDSPKVNPTYAEAAKVEKHCCRQIELKQLNFTIQNIWSLCPQTADTTQTLNSCGILTLLNQLWVDGL